MPDPRNFRLRVTFRKQGRLALLSHLEVARALERAVRRAGLPFAVSEGFSPHMKIAFGAALPVGVGGARELFDLQLTRYVPPEQALEALQAASVPDLMPRGCVYVDAHAPAASAAYPVGTYRALLSCAPAALPVPEEVRVVRKRKEKALRVADFLVGEMELAGATLTFSLESKPTGSLRPDVLLTACCAEANAEAVGMDGTEANAEAAVAEPSAAAEPRGATDSRGADAAPMPENPLAFLVENVDPTLIDADACTERNLLRVLTITRIDQHPA